MLIGASIQKLAYHMAQAAMIKEIEANAFPAEREIPVSNKARKSSEGVSVVEPKGGTNNHRSMYTYLNPKDFGTVWTSSNTKHMGTSTGTICTRWSKGY